MTLEGVQVTEAVHGTRMCIIWSIVGDDNLEHSRVHVLFRNGQPFEGVYAHTPARAGKCCFYAPWERPRGPCGVAARVFLRTKSDEQGVIRPKNSDQLVLARPFIHTVVFQRATLGSLITGEKVSAAWDIRSERVPKQWLSKLAEVPGQVVSSNVAPPVEPPVCMQCCTTCKRCEDACESVCNARRARRSWRPHTLKSLTRD